MISDNKLYYSEEKLEEDSPEVTHCPVGEVTLRSLLHTFTFAHEHFFLNHSGWLRAAPVRALVSWTAGWRPSNRWKTPAWFLSREEWKRWNLPGARKWKVHQKLLYLLVVLTLPSLSLFTFLNFYQFQMFSHTYVCMYVYVVNNPSFPYTDNIVVC